MRTTGDPSSSAPPAPPARSTRPPPGTARGSCSATSTRRLAYPTGATTPEPDAAKSCGFTDGSNTTYRCELRAGTKFADGDTLDAQAVKHSIDRIRQIDVAGGPAGLLGSLARVQVTGAREVVFHLNKPDATFPFVLATPAMSTRRSRRLLCALAPQGRQGLRLRAVHLKSYDDGKQAQLVRNDRYKGFAKRENSAVTIRYFQDSGTMVKAPQDRKIDVTYRGLAADDIVTLQGSPSRTTHERWSTARRHRRRLPGGQPQDRWARNPAVRKAVAQDRRPLGAIA
ncbi:ABC transporter substrate-binding protein [Streptomyces sp. L7]